MPQTLVLARNIQEANRYARAAGLQRFSYRAVRSAGSIRGVRHAEVHLLSSFLRRPDKHAIMGELRWAKTLEVLYVDFVDGRISDGTEPEETPSVVITVVGDDVEPPQSHTDLVAKVLPEKTPTEESSGKQARTPEPSQDAAPAEKPEPRKRAAAKKSAPAKPAPAVAPADDLFA